VTVRDDLAQAAKMLAHERTHIVLGHVNSVAEQSRWRTWFARSSGIQAEEYSVPDVTRGQQRPRACPEDGRACGHRRAFDAERVAARGRGRLTARARDVVSADHSGVSDADHSGVRDDSEKCPEARYGVRMVLSQDGHGS
jgi:hypothetical protein